MNILLSVGKRVEQTSLTPKCGTYGDMAPLSNCRYTLKQTLNPIIYHLSINFTRYFTCFIAYKAAMMTPYDAHLLDCCC